MISQQMPVHTPTARHDDMKARPQESTETGAMVYSPARPVTMRYQFVNQHPGVVELWLSLPPELPTQRDVQINDMTPEPVSIELDGNGINRLAYFRLEPGVELRFTLQAQLYRAQFASSAPSAGVSLSEQERATYLRSSPMIQVTDDVRAEAQRIVGDAATPLNRARRLYLHLIKNYSYKWPPAARGSETMRRNKRGDCGEYSWLYAAWCRSLGIPCRVMIGAWARGQMQAHVWNEVFIDGIGWMPLDTSYHQTVLRIPGLADLDWALQRIDHRFGRIRPDRLVFSIDPDVALRPGFVDHAAPAESWRFPFGGKSLAWGFESLSGAAPYLQPMYPRFTQAKPTAPSNALTNLLMLFWPPLAIQRWASLMGSWHFADPLRHRLWTWFAMGGYAIAALITITGAIWSVSTPFRLFSTLGYLLGTVWLIQFGGVRWWKMGLLLLFTLSLIEIIL
jgi:hypothetical protein